MPKLTEVSSTSNRLMFDSVASVFNDTVGIKSMQLAETEKSGVLLCNRHPIWRIVCAVSQDIVGCDSH
jgi:hypothetical protein